MTNEEPIARIPIFTEIEDHTIEGSLLVFDDYLELRKVVKPNRKIPWNEIEKIDIKYDILPGYTTKQHNSLATTANILNMLDFTLTGKSIGYQHQGFTTQTPYVLLYQESIFIYLVKSDSDQPSSVLHPSNLLTFRYVRENQNADPAYDNETKQRITAIDELKAIISDILEKQKKADFENWRQQNVKDKIEE